jgi:hypothetical protein
MTLVNSKQISHSLVSLAGPRGAFYHSRRVEKTAGRFLLSGLRNNFRGACANIGALHSRATTRGAAPNVSGMTDANNPLGRNAKPVQWRNRKEATCDPPKKT